MTSRDFLLNEYIDWRNNYLTYAKFSEDRGLSEDQGKALIELGREVFNTQEKYLNGAYN